MTSISGKTGLIRSAKLCTKMTPGPSIFARLPHPDSQNVIVEER
jgi:hypothetical protein